MTVSRRSHGEAGFTLIELIVCLGVVGLTAALLAQGIAIAGWAERLMAYADDHSDARAARRHLVSTLSRIIAVDLGGSDYASRIAFVGVPDRLRLIARADGWLEGGGLVIVELTVENSEDGRALVETRSGAAGVETRHVLLGGVEGVVFRYFGELDDQRPPAWHTSWRREDALPRLVEMRVTGGQKAIFAPLVVELPVGAGVAGH